jgi:exopolyphosphatase / guanosine-5'-triphosphate,3'-diphosphate pyrophosphatase
MKESEEAVGESVQRLSNRSSQTVEPRAVAVIDIGASAVRLVVAELSAGRPPLLLEEASLGVQLGQDTFSSGRIGAATIDRAVRALSGFLRITDGYRVAEIRAVATSAVREAANADTFLDRVRVRTGLIVDVIDGSEESRLTYLAVQAGLRGHAALDAPSALLVEVGGGSVDLTLLDRGQPMHSGVYPLGAIRLRQRLATWHGPHQQRIRLLKRQVAHVVSEIVGEIPIAGATHVIALGGEMRFVAEQLVETGDQHVREFSRDGFLAFCDDVETCDPESLVERFRLTQVDAETLVPSLLVYRGVLRATAASHVVVPDVSLRAGILADLLTDTSGRSLADFRSHVLASARSLGAKYHFDEPHATTVARLSTRLFDELRVEHALNERDRLLLEVAALLHDIGLFISLRGHHRHSLYLLQASEIFGLSRDDMQFVGNIARYHRRGLPQSSHGAYASLDRDERVRINKLAAILRLANALDAEHLQKIGDLRIHDEDGVWVLTVEGKGDLTMERLAATSRSDLLADVFGKRVTIRGAGAGS